MLLLKFLPQAFYLFYFLFLQSSNSLFHISLSSSALAKVFVTRSSLTLVSFRCSLVSFVCTSSFTLALLACTAAALNLAGTAAGHCSSVDRKRDVYSSNRTKPGWERHLSRLVRPRGTHPGFVRQVASRESSIPLSHDTQTCWVQHSLLPQAAISKKSVWWSPRLSYPDFLSEQPSTWPPLGHPWRSLPPVAYDRARL